VAMNMKPPGIALSALVCLAVVLHCVGCAEQKSGTPPTTATTEDQGTQMNADSHPSLILKLQGALGDQDATYPTGVVGILFAIYEQKEGGGPLWQEVQNIELDKRGHFTAPVGSTTKEGIPAELFATEETLWLGEQVLLPGEVELPRIRLWRTSHGLMADVPARPRIRAESGDRRAPDQAQEASDDATGSQGDQSAPTKRQLRVSRRFYQP
jgi:hypothetical protein